MSLIAPVDRILFGTDWPVIDPERAVQEIDELALRKESFDAMMRDNAMRLFALPQSAPAAELAGTGQA